MFTPTFYAYFQANKNEPYETIELKKIGAMVYDEERVYCTYFIHTGSPNRPVIRRNYTPENRDYLHQLFRIAKKYNIPILSKEQYREIFKQHKLPYELYV